MQTFENRFQMQLLESPNKLILKTMSSVLEKS